MISIESDKKDIGIITNHVFKWNLIISGVLKCPEIFRYKKQKDVMANIPINGDV